MAKGTPRNATASQFILRQSETPEPEAVKVSFRTVTEDEWDQRKGNSGSDTPTSYRPAKSGVKAGLREGETRITCIYREDQSQVLHDWAKTTGRTFREVCLAMADRYIEEVIRPATSGERKLKRTGEPPEAYADLYEMEASADEWAQFF